MTDDEIAEPGPAEPGDTGSEGPRLSEENKARIEKWGVKNPKGRTASLLSIIVWTIFIIMLVLLGNWNIGPLLLMLMFILLLALSGVRFYQEWKEHGDWLDDDVVENGASG